MMRVPRLRKCDAKGVQLRALEVAAKGQSAQPFFGICCMYKRNLTISLWMLIAISCLSVTDWPPVLLYVRAQQQQPANEQRLGRGGRVIVRNRSGRVTITGWDRDTVQATATRDGQTEAVIIRMTEDASGGGALLIAPEVEHREVQLDIKLPRNAQIESVSTGNGSIEVTDISGSVNISSNGGRVAANRTGPLEVRTNNGGVTITSVSGSANVRTNSGSLTAKAIKGDFTARVTSGELQVEDVSGSINATVTSGGTRIQNAGGDVRVISISGVVSVGCAKGRVEVGNTSGPITLTNVEGDVDATTTSGDVIFTGLMRAGGRYRLKSLSGGVQMNIQPDAPDFTATIASFSGEIETDFPLKIESPFGRGPINRRIIGRYEGKSEGKSGGDTSGTHATLESFSGSARLSKAAPLQTTGCRR